MGSQANHGGFRAKMEHYLYSGEKKHVAAGMAIIGVLFGVPWYLMNRGTLSIHQFVVTGHLDCIFLISTLGFLFTL